MYRDAEASGAELVKPLIQATGLEKTYQMEGASVEVLRGVDFTLLAGETAAIVGPSGSGKSTLLHLLGLLDTPTAGAYRFAGADALTLSERDKARFRLQRIGFIFQFHHLLPEFTALENVQVPLLMFGVSKAESIAQASELLRAVGLENRLSHKPGELSGGEQQRVALARSLVNHPALILADEPTGNLDVEAAVRMKDLLWKTCADHKASVVVVTHNPIFAAEADTRLRMLNGRLVPE